MMSNAACPYPACITDIIAISSTMPLKAHRCQISPMKNPPTSVGRSTPIECNFLDRGSNFLDNPAIHALPGRGVRREITALRYFDPLADGKRMRPHPCPTCDRVP